MIVVFTVYSSSSRWINARDHKFALSVDIIYFLEPIKKRLLVARAQFFFPPWCEKNDAAAAAADDDDDDENEKEEMKIS